MQDEIKREDEVTELTEKAPKTKKRTSKNNIPTEEAKDTADTATDEEFAEMPTSFFSLPSAFFSEKKSEDDAMEGEEDASDDDDVAALVNEALIAIGKETSEEVTEEPIPADENDEDSADDAEPKETKPIDDRYVNVEHFSSLHEMKFLSDDEDEEPITPEEESEDEENSVVTDDNAVDASEAADIDMSDLPTQEEEYENLTIFDDNEVEEESSSTAHNTNTDEEGYDPKKPRKVDGRFDLIELFVFTLAAIMLITTFFFKHSIVEGPSMESTLYDGDHLIISDFLYEPKQYDVVVVHDVEAYPAPVVKRVIATEGQTVTLIKTINQRVSSKDNVYFSLEILVDGVPIDPSYAHYSNSGFDPINIDITYENHTVVEMTKTSITYEYVVPEGEVYVLGDHRNRSQDSREFGSVKVDAILGKVLFRIYPFSDFGAIE